MAPEPLATRCSGLSWRRADLGAGGTYCWSNRPLWCPRYLLATIAQTTPFVEGNRYRRYPHDDRDAVADTHAPGFQPEAPAGRSHAGVPRGPKSTKLAQDPAGWHKRSNVLKLFTKVRAAQGPRPCCTRSGWPRRMRRRTSLLTGSSPPTEPSTPRRSSARPRTGSTVDLDDFPAEHWAHLRTTDPFRVGVRHGAPASIGPWAVGSAQATWERDRSTASATTPYSGLREHAAGFLARQMLSRICPL